MELGFEAGFWWVGAGAVLVSCVWGRGLCLESCVSCLALGNWVDVWCLVSGFADLGRCLVSGESGVEMAKLRYCDV